MSKKVDTRGLEEFATTKGQRRILQAYRKHSSMKAAADAIGISERSAWDTMARIRKKAARGGWAPGTGWEFGVAPGYELGKVTTQRNAAGEVVQVWDRQSPESQAQAEAIRKFVEELVQDHPPRKRSRKPRAKGDKDLLVIYPIGDHHFGMYADQKEVGAGYDLDRARDLLEDAVDYLVESAPPSQEAIIANLGDFLHVDDSTNRTRRSGHILDVGQRHHEMIEAAAFTLARTIERALEKHQRVKIINVKGNHDGDSASWLSLFMVAWFRNEPRVQVEGSPSLYLYHKFGKNLFCFTHGDRVKLPDLAGVMAQMVPKLWGETKFRHALTGHVHHSQTVNAKNHRGALAETFGVLPPADAHGAGAGYQGAAQREMQAITYRREGGILSRVYYTVDE